MKRQRGVAVVTALLLTTLAITIVASLFWQQQVQVRTIENQRLQQQAKWVLLGALDWARLILREDAKTSAVDHLGEPWAMPLADTRLDDYLEKDSSNTSSASISGEIIDAQARFNLTNLASARSINIGELMVFERLLANLNISPALAKNVAETIAATPTGGIESGDAASSLSIGITQVDDLLTVPGFTQEMVSRLKNFVVVLPRFTSINVNTASAEVLAARISKLSLSDAAGLVASREQAYFRDNADFTQRLPRDAQTVGVSEIAVSTNYFVVHGAVKVDRATQQVDALVERSANGTSIIWIRDY